MHLEQQVRWVAPNTPFLSCLLNQGLASPLTQTIGKFFISNWSNCTIHGRFWREETFIKKFFDHRWKLTSSFLYGWTKPLCMLVFLFSLWWFWEAYLLKVMPFFKGNVLPGNRTLNYKTENPLLLRSQLFSPSSSSIRPSFGARMARVHWTFKNVPGNVVYLSSHQKPWEQTKPWHD